MVLGAVDAGPEPRSGVAPLVRCLKLEEVHRVDQSHRVLKEPVRGQLHGLVVDQEGGDVGHRVGDLARDHDGRVPGEGLAPVRVGHLDLRARAVTEDLHVAGQATLDGLDVEAHPALLDECELVDDVDQLRRGGRVRCHGMDLHL